MLKYYVIVFILCLFTSGCVQSQMAVTPAKAEIKQTHTTATTQPVAPTTSYKIKVGVK
jgi:PBP1b-binding outer membrane lipoprotein LpoB